MQLSTSWCLRSSQTWKMRHHWPWIRLMMAWLEKMRERERVCGREREGREEYDGTGETCVDDTDAERVHQDRLHHFTVQKKEGESVVS